MISLEERDKVLSSIGVKLDTKEELTIDEQYIACENMPFDQLLKFSFCQDEYFKKVFVALKTDQVSRYYKLSERDPIYFQGLVNEWKAEMLRTDHSDVRMRSASKETRAELRRLWKEEYDRISAREYQNRRNGILAWSKYRFILLKAVFDRVLKGQLVRISLKEDVFVMDFKTYYHITARHFADTMKPYRHLKDHFSQDFLPEDLHEKLGDIFSEIAKTNFLENQNLKLIYFKLNARIYRVASNKAGGENEYRIQSFHPISDLTTVDGYYENHVSSKLSVFCKQSNQ